MLGSNVVKSVCRPIYMGGWDERNKMKKKAGRDFGCCVEFLLK